MASRRNLAGFTGAGSYHGPVWQFALWYAVQNLVFQKWWCPVGWRVKLLRLFGATIGEGVQVRRNVYIHLPTYLNVGDHAWIGDDVQIINPVPMWIGNDVCLSQGSMLCLGGHNAGSPTFEYSNGTAVLKDGAWVATRAIVLRDVTLGENSVVGPYAIVSRDVEDDGVVLAGERH